MLDIIDDIRSLDISPVAQNTLQNGFTALCKATGTPRPFKESAVFTALENNTGIFAK